MDPLAMARAGPPAHPLIEWCAAQQPKGGEVESGDRYAVKLMPEVAYVAVIDGLGHGAEAAEAARRAALEVEAAAEETCASLMQRCHAALHATRGAVMGLAVFGAGDAAMQWLCIGNIDGVILRAQAPARPPITRLLARGGIVGYRLPPLHTSTVAIDSGDLLILATDGIRADYADHLTPGEAPRELADRILARFATGTDDALVLVARYLGRAP